MLISRVPAALVAVVEAGVVGEAEAELEVDGVERCLHDQLMHLRRLLRSPRLLRSRRVWKELRVLDLAEDTVLGVVVVVVVVEGL